MVGNYDSIIAEASRRFNVPEATIRAVMATESGGRPGAVSSAGAGGLMQIMPATYAELARKHGLGADRFDPVNNIMGGAAYLRQMNDLFGGDWNDTFGGYNAGPGRWSLVKAGKANAPAETAQYITDVNARLGNPGSSSLEPKGDTVAFTPTIPRLTRPQPGQVISQPGYIPENERDLRTLISDDAKNYQNGLGNLTGNGQTPSQPPNPVLKTRIDDLINQLSQPGSMAPPPSQLGLMFAGAQGGVQQLASVHDRPVGIGELIGAMGSGVTQGYLKGNEAQQQYRQGQFAELGVLSKVEEERNKPGRDLPAAIQTAQALGLQPGSPEWNAYLLRATLPVSDGTTPAMKNAAALGLKQGTPEYDKFIRENSGPGGTNVNMPPLEKEEQKEFGKALVEEYTGVRNAADAAQNNLAQIQIARKIPITTGATAPYFAQVGAIAEALGFNKDKVLKDWGLNEASNAQAFQGVMANLVLTKLAGQKGVQTKEDAARIEQTVASLGNTPEAADFLLRTSQALAQRDIDRRTFYDQWRADKKTFEGAGEAWRQHIADMPLVGYNPKSNMPVFYDEFQSAMREDNPHLGPAEIRQIWQEKYGGKPPQNTEANKAGVGKAIETLTTTLGPAFADFAKQYLGIDPAATAEQIERAWRARNG